MRRTIVVLLITALGALGLVTSVTGCSCGSTAQAAACSTNGGSAPVAGPECELDLDPLAVIAEHVIARIEMITCDVPATAVVTVTIEYSALGTNSSVTVARGHSVRSGRTPILGFNATADCSPGYFTGTATITGAGDNGAPIVMQDGPDTTDTLTVSSYSLCE